MDLLDMLGNSMLTDSSLKAISGKTGATEDQSKAFVASAIPVLLKSMTENASSEEGARSLRSALDQHTNTGMLDRQIEDADMEDGSKIVRHILGDKSDHVVQALAAETNMSQEQVTRGLGSLAPALLSVLFAALKAYAKKPNNSGGFDLSDLLGMFGGSTNQSPYGSILGSLLGMGGNTQNTPSLGASLLGGLLGGQSQQSAPSLGGSLLSGLLQGGNQNSGQGLGSMLGSLFGSAPAQNNAGSFSGMDLLNLLNALK